MLEYHIFYCMVEFVYYNITTYITLEIETRDLHTVLEIYTLYSGTWYIAFVLA